MAKQISYDERVRIEELLSMGCLRSEIAKALQRVGRLNRYGQTKQVHVVSVRNPDTVESRVWDKLTEKLTQTPARCAM